MTTTDLLISNTKQIILSTIGNKVEALYLHGSYILGDLKPKSDLDVLVVLNQGLTLADKQLLSHCFMDLSGEIGSNKRYLEVAFININDTKQVSDLANLEFVYGEWLREDFIAGVFEPVHDLEYRVMMHQAIYHHQLIYGTSALSDYLKPCSVNEIKETMYEMQKNIEFEMSDIDNLLFGMLRTVSFFKQEMYLTKDQAARYVLDNYNLSSSNQKVIDTIINNYTKGNSDNVLEQDAYSLYLNLKHMLESERGRES